MDTFKFAVRHLRPLRFIPALPHLFDSLLLAFTVLRHPEISRSLDAIDHALMTWPGVTKGLHRFGGTEYRLGNHELGHVHGNGLLDIPLSKSLREQLVADGRARPHQIYPHSGWISFNIHSEADVPNALALLHLAYERRQSLLLV
ncbi:MAG: DUF5519 family protein [Armatimonadota bacterium]|nr:DUF5519 family protein [Armatimonadota bacterium]